MTTIKPLIKSQQRPRRLGYKPCAVIVGRTGAGKTTLVNNLCGTTHDSGAGLGSITRNLYRNDVSCGSNSFSLIDTPGTDSSTETYKHAYLLRQGLTATAINTIFIVIKYDNRFNKMLDNYYEVEQPLYNYSNKIVAMISHWDLSEKPEKDYPEICNVFKDSCSNVIYYSDKSSKIEVVSLMYSCISNMKQENLTINNEDFFLNFNIAEIKRGINRSLLQYRQKAQQLFQEYSSVVISIHSAAAEDKDEVLHMLIVEFKNEMETLLVEFRKAHGGEMSELDYYTFYIKMQKENVKLCDSFVEKVIPLMSYNLFDNGDPRNLIKQCPHCGLIWFKTEGCDGQTSCGNNGFSSYFDLSVKPFWKYILRRVNGTLRWEKNQMAKKQLVKPTQNNTTSQRVGCGKPIIWGELPKIQDEIILELFKVKTIEEAKQLIQSGHFVEVRQDYERNIDTNFYS
jgi:small GTP-binding protein